MKGVIGADRDAETIRASRGHMKESLADRGDGMMTLRRVIEALS